MPATNNQANLWPVLAFAILAMLALLPFSERSLVMIPNTVEQGLLAQQVSEEGAESILGNLLSGRGAASAGSLATGARRLIARQIARIGTPVGGNAPATGTAPDLDELLNGALADQGENAPALLAGLGDGLPGQNPSASPAGTGGQNGLNGPIGPGFGSGGATNLASPIAPVVEPATPAVPEASTWVLMIFGLLLVAAALRARSSSVRLQISQCCQA